MTLTIDQWHQRYLQQARWTQSVRSYLYQKCMLQQADRILDVGCGTGVLEDELSHNSHAYTYGIDIDVKALLFARDFAPKSIYCAGDCLALPFQTAIFDITLCHFLLLWVNQVQNAIMEMARVTRPHGFVLAIAEPDYGGRIDYPGELSQMGLWQTQALKDQGADPFIGRQLRMIFTRAGLEDISTGVLGGQWDESESEPAAELEWQVIEADLANNLEFRRRADQLKALEFTSRRNHSRILFVPVFYALGKVTG